MHKNAELIFEKYALPLIPNGETILDVGAGKKFWKSPFLRLAKERGWIYKFCDEANFGTQSSEFVSMSSPYRIDCADGSFGVVIASQVIEHVTRPWLWVPELARVTRSGGLVVLVCPLSWNWHRCPIDAFRVMPDGMRILFEDAGLGPKVTTFDNLDGGVNNSSTMGGKSPVYDCIGIGVKP